jgi:undecaprenyl-diphosphatase
MDILQAVLLGIVQGITEWLPVSSSGHLAILQNLFGLGAPVLFDIMLHLGTILAVVVVFWKEILEILKAVVKFDFTGENGKLAIFIIVAMVPTAIIGFAFKKTFESLFSNLTAIGIALIITGCFLFICERFKRKAELGFKESLLVGIAQGIAIIPGISRSGATIGTGLLLGIEKEKVAKFSFLLSIPAIIGASIFDFNATELASVGWNYALIGIIISAVVGYLTIKLLLNIIKKQKFWLFSIYCWILGAIIVLGKVFNIL